MYNAKALAARGQTEVGRWFTFLVISFLVTALPRACMANAASNSHVGHGPVTNFFHYEASKFENRLAPPSFGLFKRLSTAQSEKYLESASHALSAAENGERVAWMVGDASGYAVPVLTWPTGTGFCRRLHISIRAFGEQRVRSETACLDAVHNQWRWVGL